MSLPGDGDTLVVPERFRGPARSGNGGWSAGALARRLPQAQAGWGLRVRLQLPPPLSTPMRIEHLDGGLAALSGDRVVMLARAVDPASTLAATPPAPVTFGEALATAPTFAGLQDHPFPTCFTCGTARTPDDGLCLRPGPVPGRPGSTAAAWVPHASVGGADGRVTFEVCWAALDCPGAWGIELEGRPLVLGTMTAMVAQRPHFGERCVVVGQALRHEGRKAWTETVLYGEGQEVLARAAAVWLEVDPGAVAPA